ncbi:hypothetical protein Terro_0917 [Terriglobus roseus DSM 18391]|uniref:Uncharacterized protein n=1 Tax=Terriglobus roseus (strain DSM 18391 / NRRL B-41598 / KBS 63) TaxID=926566 RepID=I3ZDC1_TERRK|nr:hypothetical protein [Terriglobus roseus]AFL87239.1 hypothetical protein Terro_0917 [Terriglobus roseus DSM 18391]
MPRLTFLLAVAVTLVVPVAIQAQGAVEGPLPQLAGRDSQMNPSAPPPAQNKQLDNDAIIKMTKAELGDNIIVTAVRMQPGSYLTAPDDLIALKSAGVSQAVISAMLARNSGMQQRGSMLPMLQQRVDVSPLSPNVDDPGVYFKNTQGQWEMMGPELVHYRDGGALKSLVTNNIVKKDENGVVNGPKSKLSLSPGTEVLILSPNMQIDAVEYVILRFRTKSDRREFRVRSGNVFHSETGTERDALEVSVHKVGNRLFGFTIPKDLAKGEYGVLAPWSAGGTGIGHAGKIYTFDITE